MVSNLAVKDALPFLDIAKLKGNDIAKCYLCPDEIVLRGMRIHVGKHILQAVWDPDDAQRVRIKPVRKITHVTNIALQIGFNPCGWSGRDDCKTQVEAPSGRRKTVKLTYNCTYRYERTVYTFAITFKKRGNPCTGAHIVFRCHSEVATWEKIRTTRTARSPAEGVQGRTQREIFQQVSRRKLCYNMSQYISHTMWTNPCQLVNFQMTRRARMS